MEFHVEWNLAPTPQYGKKPLFQVTGNTDHFCRKNIDFPVAGNMRHLDCQTTVIFPKIYTRIQTDLS